MAASPLDGIYWAFSIPLGLYNLILNVLGQTQSDPNTPQIHTSTAPREWFSQPRPAAGSPPRLTFITLGGEGSDAWNQVPGVTAQYEQAVARALDPRVWTWRQVRYPLDDINAMAVNHEQAYQIGKANVIAAINDTTGKFALGGYSAGAAVMSQVYDEIRSGSLTHRRGDLLAATMFGNLAREEGHTIPGGTDPTGHGVRDEEHRLIDTEELWWDFANGGEYRDVYATNGDDQYGQDLTAVYEATVGNWPDTQAELIAYLEGSLLVVAGQIAAYVQFLWDGLFFVSPYLAFLSPDLNTNGNQRYHFPYPGSSSGRTAVELATDYLTTVGINYQIYATPVPVTEVITSNFKLPLSLSEVGFEALRVACHIEVWYQDRQNNWMAVLDESRVPITLSLSTSQSASWYKAHFYCYPIVCKAVQFRFSRLADPAVGNRPYCVGMRNALLRRNIYQRSDGTMGIEPQQDPLGNTWTSYVKDWTPPRPTTTPPPPSGAPCRCPTRWRWPACTWTAGLLTGVRSCATRSTWTRSTPGRRSICTTASMTIRASSSPPRSPRCPLLTRTPTGRWARVAGTPASIPAAVSTGSPSRWAHWWVRTPGSASSGHRTSTRRPGPRRTRSYSPSIPPTPTTSTSGGPRSPTTWGPGRLCWS